MPASIVISPALPSVFVDLLNVPSVTFETPTTPTVTFESITGASVSVGAPATTVAIGPAQFPALLIEAPNRQINMGVPIPLGGGESNTASNVGIGGVGPFFAKVGTDLRFKSLISVDKSISIVDNPANNTIEIGTLSRDVCGEVLAGTRDGVNQAYTTSVDFVAGTEKVFINGKRALSTGGFCDYVISESGGAGTGFDTVTLGLIKPRTDTALLIDYTKA